MKWTDHYTKAFALSYDDGVYQDIRLVEILNRYGLKATFNLNSGLMNDPSSAWEAEGVRVERMPPDLLPSLYQGHEIASHLTRHQNPIGLDNDALRMDILCDKAALEDLFGCEVTGFAYPFGAADSRVEAVLAECGISYARGVQSTHAFDPPADLLHISPTCRHKEENLFDLTERFIALQPDRPQIFLLWGHSYEFDMQQGWERFERFCERMAGHDDIFYGTCSELFGALRTGERR